jgi:hypothetical protein
VRPREKRREAAAVEDGGIPVCLLAGRCLDVWSPGVEPGGWPQPDWYRAWRRWGLAREWWLHDQGIDPWDHHAAPRGLAVHTPWSFAFLEEEDPEALREALARHHLPAQWRPEDSAAEAIEWIARGTPPHAPWRDRERARTG